MDEPNKNTEDAPKKDLWDKLIIDCCEDDVMKAIFEHVRNLIVIGGVLAAGIWKFKNLHDDYFALANDVFAGSLLILLAAWLFLLNQSNGIRKVRQLRHRLPRGWLFFFLEAYSVVAGSIALSLAIR